MPEEREAQSKYALKLAQRRSADNGSKTPYPAPMQYDYTRPYMPVVRHDGGDIRPLPCENMKLAAKFKRPHFTP